MFDLTAFQRDLLFVVAGMDEPHGLGIKAELEKYYDVEVNHGRLYPNLNELVDGGLLSKAQVDRRTNAYALTEKGREAIRARRRWEAQYVDPGAPGETAAA
jgi:DNA-binding PadR family transcriptional regulator